MKGFRFESRSDQTPEYVFSKLAMASAVPSIIPRELIEAPRIVVKKIGVMG